MSIFLFLLLLSSFLFISNPPIYSVFRSDPSGTCETSHSDSLKHVTVCNLPDQ